MQPVFFSLEACYWIANPGNYLAGNARVCLEKLVRHPKVFLFDEPLSNLDAKFTGSDALRDKRIGAK